MQLILEAFIWTLESEDAIRYHRLQVDITQSVLDPDIVLNDQLNRLGLIEPMAARYIHSTSWRYEVGRTLLTYLVWRQRK